MEYSVERYHQEYAYRMIELLLQTGYRLELIGGWNGYAIPGMLEYIVDGTTNSTEDPRKEDSGSGSGPTNSYPNSKLFIDKLWNWRQQFPKRRGDTSLNLWWKQGKPRTPLLKVHTESSSSSSSPPSSSPPSSSFSVTSTSADDQDGSTQEIL